MKMSIKIKSFKQVSDQQIINALAKDDANIKIMSDGSHMVMVGNAYVTFYESHLNKAFIKNAMDSVGKMDIEELKEILGRA